MPSTNQVGHTATAVAPLQWELFFRGWWCQLGVCCGSPLSTKTPLAPPKDHRSPLQPTRAILAAPCPLFVPRQSHHHSITALPLNPTSRTPARPLSPSTTANPCAPYPPSILPPPTVLELGLVQGPAEVATVTASSPALAAFALMQRRGLSGVGITELPDGPLVTNLSSSDLRGLTGDRWAPPSLPLCWRCCWDCLLPPGRSVSGWGGGLLADCASNGCACWPLSAAGAAAGLGRWRCPWGPTSCCSGGLSAGMMSSRSRPPLPSR